MKTVLATPCSATRSSDGLSITVSLAQSTRALSSRCKSAQLAMLLDWIADPIDLWIATDCVVVWIDADDFEVFVSGILCDPVWVQDTETSHTTTNTFLKLDQYEYNAPFCKQWSIPHLSNRLQFSVWLQLVDTMALGLAVSASLVYWTLAASTTNADAIDEESLLCTISQATCLVRARWTWSTMESRQLTILPAANAQQVSQDIALFLAIQLLNVTICTHCCYSEDRPSNEIKIQILWSEVTSSVY